MTNQIDLIYTESDLFITFIAGDSTFSKSIYSDLVNQNNNSPKILSIHKKQVLNQLKKAGYIVKARKIRF